MTITTSVPPAGVTAAIANNGTTGTISSVTFSSSANTPVGTYPIAISATGSGVSAASAIYTLSIAAASGGVVADWDFCGNDEIPVYFAYQDGDATWQSVQPTITGTVTRYRFSLSQARGGVAYVTQSSTPARVGPLRGIPSMRRLAGKGLDRSTLSRSGRLRRNVVTPLGQLQESYGTEVVYATRQELVNWHTCQPATVFKSVDATVRGLADSQWGLLSLGGSLAFAYGNGAEVDVSFNYVSPGNLTLVGTRSSDDSADRMLLLRNVNVPDGSAIPQVLDFAGAAAFLPASATITSLNTHNDSLLLTSSLVSAAGAAQIVFVGSAGKDVARMAVGVPSARMLAGELHMLELEAAPSPGDAIGDTRSIEKFVGPIVTQSLSLGTLLPPVSVTQVTAGAYPTLRFRATIPPQYRSGAGAYLFDSTFTRVLSFVATEGYMVAATVSGELDVITPDLGALAGFPIASRLQVGATACIVGATGWDRAGSLFDPSIVPVVGQTTWSALRTFEIIIR
ncbi:MAG: hypothetical protein IT360_10255 [Gemmatimonadaceae bacterium]|nr:hypothetical protein [Gemmatimonadaceae bacterium]